MPRYLKDSDQIREIEELLNEVKKKFPKIEVEKYIMNRGDELKLKTNVLWYISVWKRIGIAQTRRTKSLYPQLVVFINNEPATFYPQRRTREEITIKDFLKGLLEGKVLCLHEKFEIEEELKKLKK